MYKALLIGVNEYTPGSGYYTLPAVELDLFRLCRILFYSQCNYSIQTITCKEAYCNQIKSQLNVFFGNSEDADVLFFYWAGHGNETLSEGGQLICNDTVGGKDSIGMKYVAD